jgi:hypothetical protein
VRSSSCRGGERFRSSVDRDACSEDQASARRRPQKRTPLVKQGSALRPLDPSSPPIPSISGTLWPTKALLRAGMWAREELNLRPLPCQQTTGNRCARRRSPRSAPTVDAKGKRSLAVQLNALFQHLRRRSPAITPRRPAAAVGRVPKASGGARSPTTPIAQLRTRPDPGGPFAQDQPVAQAQDLALYLQHGGRARR